MDPLLPSQLQDEHGNFILSLKTTKVFLGFLESCELLPQDDLAYRTVLGLPEDRYNKVKNTPHMDLPALFRSFADISTHCKTFRNGTYEDLVTLASDIVNYAVQVGGPESTSFYADLVDNVQKYIAEKGKSPVDQAKVDEYKQNIMDNIQEEVNAITKLVTRAEKLYTDITTFETQCTDDQAAIQKSVNDTKQALEGEGGRIKDLERDIREKQTEWDADFDRWRTDTIIAATTPLYLAVPVIGWIAIGPVAGVFTDDALKMKAAMHDIEKAQQDDRDEIVADQAIVADITGLQTNLETLINSIGAAKQMLGAIRGAWKAIKDDLVKIRDNVSGEVERIDSAYRTKMNVKGMLAAWKKVETDADQFRKNAYMSEKPKVKTIAEAADLVGLYAKMLPTRPS